MSSSDPVLILTAFQPPAALSGFIKKSLVPSLVTNCPNGVHATWSPLATVEAMVETFNVSVWTLLVNWILIDV